MDFSTDDWTQLDIYDWLRQPYSIQKPIRLIELFAGVGSQNMALKELQDEGICTYEAYRVCEFDKFAMDAYNSIHNTNFEASDICDWHGSDLGIVDKEKYTYICFYSFPCTDLSCAGKMLGMEEGSGTRSSLLWEVKRLLDETDELPQVLIMENVPMIHNDANRPNLQKWVDYLDSKGYCTYIDDIQAYDQGVPQSRNRTFAISILGSYKFNFPRPKPLEIDASDLLEDEVDESLYLTTDAAKKCIDDMVIGGRLPRQTDRQTS